MVKKSCGESSRADHIQRQAWHRECAYGYFWENIKGIGVKAIDKRYRLLQSYEMMYKSESADGWNVQQMEAFKRKKEMWNIQEEYEKLLHHNICCVPKWLKGYPDKLMAIDDPPSALFVRGKLPGKDIPTVAVVGARKCSPYGREVARALGRRLAENGIQVVSGMAAGIDGISQKGALQAQGATFAVLGSGVDICYPHENQDLYQRLCRGENGGGVISEYVPGTEPAAWNFPMRNRIISALSDVLIVVEAKEKSGTFITVCQALEQGRDVYAIPGRMGDSLSYGCNRLIAQGAGILYDMDEFIREILGATHKIRRKEEENADVYENLGKLERDLLEILETQYVSMEELLERTQQFRGETEIAELLAALATLECGNLAESDSGFYRKKVNF